MNCCERMVTIRPMSKKLDSKYTVYAIRCTANGKMYIGCTNNVESRIKSHFFDLEQRRKRRYDFQTKTRIFTDFQSDFDKYGKRAFEYYVLQSEIDSGNRTVCESRWIAKYDTTNPSKGYNIRSGKKTELPIAFKQGLPPDGKPCDEV